MSLDPGPWRVGDRNEYVVLAGEVRCTRGPNHLPHTWIDADRRVYCPGWPYLPVQCDPDRPHGPHESCLGVTRQELHDRQRADRAADQWARAHAAPSGDGTKGDLLTPRPSGHACVPPEYARHGDVWLCRAVTSGPRLYHEGPADFCHQQWLADVDRKQRLTWRPTRGHTVRSETARVADEGHGREGWLHRPWWEVFRR